MEERNDQKFTLQKRRLDCVNVRRCIKHMAFWFRWKSARDRRLATFRSRNKTRIEKKHCEKFVGVYTMKTRKKLTESLCVFNFKWSGRRRRCSVVGKNLLWSRARSDRRRNFKRDKKPDVSLPDDIQPCVYDACHIRVRHQNLDQTQ